MEEESRVTRSKAAAKATYDKLSKWYDILAGHFEQEGRDMGLARLAAREGEKILEIGFGTGYCTLALARAVGDSGQVYGFDLSEGMLKVTTGKLEKAGLASRVDLRLGDAVRLPYESDFFDAVFMSFTLELFDTPEIPLVLAEVYRVLRPGGRTVTIAMSKEENPGIVTRLYEWAHRNFPSYADCRPIYVMEAMANAGFKITDRTRLSLWTVAARVVRAEKPVTTA